MKRHFFLVFMFSLFVSFSAEARMQKETFNSGETLTAGKLFLNQVDAVSLYLSTQRIVYVPRLTDEMQLNVSMTLLGNSLAGNREAMKNLVTRHINTFNKTLMERLEYYTPQLAKEFKPMEDVTFDIKAGSEKETVATWKNGEWKWFATVSAAVPVAVSASTTAQETPVTQTAAPEAEKRSCKKRCPALIGVPKEEAPAETPVSTEIAPQETAPIQESSVIPEPTPPPPNAARYGVGQ